MEDYLMGTPSINYMNSGIQMKVQELRDKSENQLDYIKRCYMFVRDEIPHSWDIETNIVSRTASDVLKNKTGICWTKSCLLAALLCHCTLRYGWETDYLPRCQLFFESLTRQSHRSLSHPISPEQTP